MNTTQAIWINFTDTATTASPSIRIEAGGEFKMESGFISVDQVNVIRGAGTDFAITAKEG